MNALLLDAYVADCKRIVDALEQATSRSYEVDARVSLPSQRFNRHQGIYANHFFDSAG